VRQTAAAEAVDHVGRLVAVVTDDQPASQGGDRADIDDAPRSMRSRTRFDATANGRPSRRSPRMS
jgi:hypothetical protein